MKIQIVERPKPYIKNFVEVENFDFDKLQISTKETNKNGGSFCKN